MNFGIGQDHGRKLCIGKLPGRKRPSLYLWDPIMIATLATFRSDDAAEEAERFFRSMIGARVVDGEVTPGEGESKREREGERG